MFSGLEWDWALPAFLSKTLTHHDYTYRYTLVHILVSIAIRGFYHHFYQFHGGYGKELAAIRSNRSTQKKTERARIAWLRQKTGSVPQAWLTFLGLESVCARIPKYTGTEVLRVERDGTGVHTCNHRGRKLIVTVIDSPSPFDGGYGEARSISFMYILHSIYPTRFPFGRLGHGPSWGSCKGA